MPAMLTNPRVGNTLTSALVAAGMRMEFPVSVPLPSTAMFAATAVTVPPDDDGAGDFECGDDDGVLRGDQFVAEASEAFPSGRGDLPLDRGVGLNHDRHAR